jgi:Zn-dependent peptidase ImmA (M78 family)
MDVEEYGSPATIAAHVRNAWNLPPGPIQNLTTAIESSGGIVVKCDFGAVKLDAFSQWPPGMPPLFFVNVAASPDRCRFTLAHEIGHIIMHTMPTVDLEREADEFASEFLMPKRDIVGYLGRPFSLERVAALKSYWKVAMSAIIRRAYDLGRISNSHYRALLTRMSRMGWRTQEPVPLDPEEPTVLHSVLNLHTAVHGYSIAELCDIAFACPRDFDRQFILPSKPQANHLRVVK